MKLTKETIIKSVSKTGFTNKESSELLEILLEIIKSTLENGEDVLITGFGKFCVKEKKERRGRNPQSGYDLILDARRVVTFQCSTALRDKINGRR